MFGTDPVAGPIGTNGRSRIGSVRHLQSRDSVERAVLVSKVVDRKGQGCAQDRHAKGLSHEFPFLLCDRPTAGLPEECLVGDGAETGSVQG